MKKLFKSILVYLLVILLSLQMGLSCFANTIIPNLNPARNFALGIVTKVYTNDPTSPWNQNTVITSETTVYDYTERINGYIYGLKTDSIDTGYIHIFYANNTYSLISYSYEAQHHALTSLEKYNTSLTNTLKDFNAKKLIYAGGLTFLLKSPTNTLYSLNHQQIVPESDKQEILSNYTTISAAITDDARSLQNTAQPQATGVTKYVRNANNLDIVTVYDFDNYTLNGEAVDNHCAPTAVTTLIKYWANRRDIIQLYYHSDWWVFSSLCVNMQTDFSLGTTPDNCYNGMLRYCRSTRGVMYDGTGYWGDTISEFCTFSKAKSYIDSDIPFKMGIPGHAVFCSGYSTASGYNQLIVSYGESHSWTFYAFASLNPHNYQYVYWN